MPSTARVTWVDGMQFVGEAGSGHAIVSMAARASAGATMEYIVRGRDISEKAVQDSIALSETRYCSASAMLARTAEITYTYQIIQE